MDQARLLQLDAELRRVFGDIPRPKITKSVAQSYDDDWIVTEESWKALTAMDAEQHWWELSDRELHENYNILIWLPSDAFRFYYTAFLSYALRNWAEGGDLVVQQAMEAIGSLNWGKRGRKKPGNLDDFTDEELTFIAETLVELSCDPNWEKYSCVTCLPSVMAVEHEQKWRAEKAVRER